MTVAAAFIAITASAPTMEAFAVAPLISPPIALSSAVIVASASTI
jgi:hypothetical protein